MSRILSSAHVICLPTAYGEGVPKILIEAAACSRAIVTTDVPGCRDIVRDGWNGLLIQPHDSAALANAIETLLADQTLRREMGANGRELVRTEFGIEAVIERTMQIYDELDGAPQSC
jgi:glycosyltransferase involved in cell wall biosynthesis